MGTFRRSSPAKFMGNMDGLPTVTLSNMYRSPLPGQSGAGQDGKGRCHYQRISDHLCITVNHHKIASDITA